MEICNSNIQLISSLTGGISFIVWLVAQLPQVIEIYQNKSVDGISSLFLLIWFFGDLTSFIGCIFTKQLFFQFAISTYFLFNDVIIIGQYYYYDIYKRKKLNNNNNNNNKIWVFNSIIKFIKNLLPIIFFTSNVNNSEAFMFSIESNNSIKFIGVICSWISAFLYFFARIPQLYKNYQRKSTKDLSSYLFCCTLIGNLTYTISILISCEFLFNDKRLEFFLNELPFIIGSSGTIIFDIIYFYQVYIYNKDLKNDEEVPLLNPE